MTDRDFDELLERELSELPPPADVVRGVTPWRRAMNRVLTGLALCALTLNFLDLNYILPAAGTVLMLLGFRSLRRENGFFRACYVISIIRCLIFFPGLILGATAGAAALPELPVLSYFSLGLTFILILCLRASLRSVQAKAGLEPHAGAATAMAVWFGVVLLLALVNYSGLVIGLAVIAAYIFIIRSLCRLSTELDEAGYSIAAAPLRFSDRAVALAIAAVVLLGVAAGYIFCGRYEMDWRERDAAEAASESAVRAELLTLGFPEDVLADLSPEDIAACEGAVRVVVDVTDEPVNKGREVREYDGYSTYITTVYDVKELRSTGVAVELPGERATWRIFHHFRWTVEPGFRGMEALQLWTAYRASEGWAEGDGGFSGRVLCDRDGQTRAAPYRSLGPVTYQSSSFLFGERTSTDVIAEFSFPGNAENCRGYVSYDVQTAQEGWIIDSWVNYIYQRRIQYPVQDPLTGRNSAMWNTGAYFTVQDALQFNPWEENSQPFS